MIDVHCKKCLTYRTGDVLGNPCRTPGCDGIIEEVPAWYTLVDELPEPMTCGRRSNNSPGEDRWEKFKSNGNRVCSYCGSLHPDDMFEMVRQSANAPQDADYFSTIEIEPSDKPYKIYVKQPGVRNAHEGGIKFYTHHLSFPIAEDRQAEFAKAVHASRARLNRQYPRHQ